MIRKSSGIERNYAPKQPSLQKVALEVKKSDTASGWLRPTGYFISVHLGVKIVLFLFSSF